MAHRTRSVRAPRPTPGLVPSPGSDWTGLAENRDLLVSYLAPRCRDEHEAEDLSHETLLRAVRFRRTQRDRSRLTAWLVHIAANLHRDHVRRESRRWAVPLDDPSVEVAAVPCPHTSPWPEPVMCIAQREYPPGEVLDALARAWRGLAERERVLLDAFYRVGGSTDAAARAADVRRDLVKVRLHRARRRLEDRIRIALRAADVARSTTRARVVMARTLRS